MSHGDGFPSIDAWLDYTDDRRYILTVEAADGTILRRIVDTLGEIGRAQYEMGASALGLPQDQILVALHDKWPPWLHVGQIVRVRPHNDHRFTDPRGGLAVIEAGFLGGGLYVNGVDLDADGTSVGGIFAAEDLDDHDDFTPAELARVRQAQETWDQESRPTVDEGRKAPHHP